MAIHFYSTSETHRELSNFAPYAIELDGLLWATVENFYQAQKFTDPALQDIIRKADKPIIAKNLADQNRERIRPGWEAMKDAVMDRAVRRKFETHSELRAILLSTGDEDLLEAAPSDTYWGIGREGNGLNKLGRILMRIRAELRAGGEDPPP
jgi:ribA/ribD-fused uncharacterized protein